MEGLKYIPGANRANNTAALKNKPKHNKGVNLKKLFIRLWSKLSTKKMIDIIWVKIIGKGKPTCAAYGIQSLYIYSLRSVRVPFMC